MSKLNREFLLSIGLNGEEHEEVICKILDNLDEIEETNKPEVFPISDEIVSLQEKLAAMELRADTAERILIERDAKDEENRLNASILDKIHAVAIKEGKLDDLGIKALKKHTLDMSKIKHENGIISNISEILNIYKNDDVIGALWGGESLTFGADVGGAVSSPNHIVTLDMVRGMSHEQIAENWDVVSKILEG